MRIGGRKNTSEEEAIESILDQRRWKRYSKTEKKRRRMQVINVYVKERERRGGEL